MKKIDTEEGESNEQEQESTTSSEKLEQDSDSDTSTQDEEASEPTQTFQTHNIVNEKIHDEDDSSAESEEENMNEMQTYENNGEQNNAQEDKVLTTNFELKVENRKVEGLITYSTDQQIFKFKGSSGTDQEVWGLYIDFQSIHS